MEKNTLKKGQAAGFCVMIVLCVLVNYFGGVFATQNRLPVWLDSIGTVEGPVCGALVGATGNLASYIIFGDNWMYAIVSIVIGVIVGFAARRKSFGSLLSIMTTAAMVTIAVTIVALPLNIIFGNNSTGNIWGDAVAGFMEEEGIPVYLSMPVGQLYVELLDKLLTLLMLYVFIRLKRFAASRKEKHREENRDVQMKKLRQEEEAAAIRTGALLLAVSLALSGTAGKARADEAKKKRFGRQLQRLCPDDLFQHERPALRRGKRYRPDERRHSLDRHLCRPLPLQRPGIPLDGQL